MTLTCYKQYNKELTAYQCVYIMWGLHTHFLLIYIVFVVSKIKKTTYREFTE